jgi:quinoprotein glucose dehydrogenase
VFATGLRNPQELAFDDYGNLFTGDNNSDSGDRARWVHVVRGGDSGWRMMYQYIPDRGPFNRERIWYPYDEQTPAYIVPPIMNLSDGPSGLVCYPGTGLDDSFLGSFFLVDFRGQASNSGVRRIRMEPQGAGFKVVSNEEFLWNILATDVDFGPDGGMYVSDWVNGWNGENKGRIYRFGPVEIDGQWLVEQTQSLLANGVKEKNDESLVEYLSHPDRRVRQLAQWELASREAVDSLAGIAGSGTASTVARLHGIWGLGQIARNTPDAKVTQQVVALLIPIANSDDATIVSRALEALADGVPSERLNESLLQSRNDAIELGLKSTSPVVQAAACHAVFQLPSERFLPSVIKVIQNNEDVDPILRHAGIMALSAGPAEKIASLSRHVSPSVRLAAVVALRRMKHPRIRDFLDDESQMVVRETVRAIHDVPELHNLLPDLAERIVGAPLDDAIVRRILNANFRLGQPSHARKLAEFAASKTSDDKYRLEALDMLGTWNRPGLNDRVLNRYLPLPDRSVQPAMDALRENMERLAAADPAIRDRFLEIGANFGLQGVGELIEASYLDASNTGTRRAAALKALAGISPDRAKTLLETALGDSSFEVRVAAIGLIGELNPDKAFSAVEHAIQSQQTLERQAAWDALGALPNQDAKAALVSKLWGMFRSGALPKDVLLNASDVFAVYMPDSLQNEYRSYRESRESLRADQPTEFYAECAEGGDIAAGRLLFFTRSSLSCVRCHKIGQTGGEVGPNLSEIGKQKTSEYLLEAIVAPNAKIADGFKTIVVQDEDGSVYSGIVKKEDDEELSLLDAQGNFISIPVDSITGRREGLSSMPVDLIKYLSLRELRDLVAYLKSLDGTNEATKGVFETESGGHALE